MIIFTNDHGCHFKTRNWEYKRSCHDASTHIPLIIYGSNYSIGIKIEELVSIIDLLPTILEIADVEIPKYMQGKSLKTLLAKTPSDWREEVFIQISESQVGRAIRTKRWKYSVGAPHKSGFLFSGSKLYREDFLYDLKADPYEQNNLVLNDEYKDIRDKLSSLLKKNMKNAGEKVPKIFPYKH